ncbi:MAG: 2,3-bisphosphoglycerate-independent phosphoglycerate mutase, partial [Caldilineaceae bacterium]|nr:2,3-bisphosphoglycerate-independent phosphoglycerate mutase [Caldilineaceae bacterium]
MTKPYRPVALIIMDGWGIREMAEGNAVVLADTPNYDRWNRTGERTVLDASGEAVGLPEGQMGNSEVGHLNLGAGRIVYQDLTRINLAIRDHSFYENQTLLAALNGVKERNGKLHLIGLLGDGGVHSHSSHLFALLEAAKRNGIEPVIHLISDGRDTPQQSGLGFAQQLEDYLQENPGVIATLCGRYYTMDRDKRWERTGKGYRLIVNHESDDDLTAPSATAALQQAYDAGNTDEFVLPVAIDVGDRDVTVEAGDCLIFTNFRADRLRQLATVFLDPNFDGFDRGNVEGLHIVTMTQYSNDFGVPVLFPDVDIVNTLAEVLSKAGRKQFHAAETEKYAHVTYFFNGGKEQQYEGETRHLEPSPKVATYDLQPEMSARPLLDAVINRIKHHDDDFILVNFANPDMVGHTGSLEAA